MTNLSDLFPTNTSPIKSIQSGYVDTISITDTGTAGEDRCFVNVTISAVINTSKCEVRFDGGYAQSGSPNVYIAIAKSGGFNSYQCTARLTSTNNLRISAPGTNGTPAGQISGRWTVVEYA